MPRQPKLPTEPITSKSIFTVSEAVYLTQSKGIPEYLKSGTIICSLDVEEKKYFTLPQLLTVFHYIDLKRIGVHRYKIDILMQKLREVERIGEYPCSIVVFFFMSLKATNHSILVAYEQDVREINRSGMQTYLEGIHPEYLSQMKKQYTVKLAGVFALNTQEYINRIRLWPTRLKDVNLPRFPKLNLI